MKIVEAVPTYWEISHSGRGLHAIWEAEKRTDRCSSGKIEIYDGSPGVRFMVLTGNHLEGPPTEVRSCQSEIDTLVAKYLPPDPQPQSDEPHTAPEPIDLDDEELLNMARNSRSGEEFRAPQSRRIPRQPFALRSADAALEDVRLLDGMG
jgi:putative DNA primase/helicase